MSTSTFMAIGALLGQRHSFMHDLESFSGCSYGYASTLMGQMRDESSRIDTWNFTPMGGLATEYGLVWADATDSPRGMSRSKI